MPQSLLLFIAYSHRDSDHLDELCAHLTSLERSNKVRIWHDGKIEPGGVLDSSIKYNLNTADIILLLVSSDSIASDYVYKKEMAEAIERHYAAKVKLIPVIVRPCQWQDMPFGQLKALPKDGKAVTAWPTRDEAYDNVTKELKALVNNILEQRAKQEQDRINKIQEEQRRQRARQEQEQEQDRINKIQEEQRQQRAKQEQELGKLMRERQHLASIETTRNHQQESSKREHKEEKTLQRGEPSSIQQEQEQTEVGTWVVNSVMTGLLMLMIGVWIWNADTLNKLSPGALLSNWFYLVIIGGIAGWLSGLFTKGTGFGLLGNIVIGVVGAFIGSLLFGFFNISVGGGILGSIIIALAGAFVLHWLAILLKFK